MPKAGRGLAAVPALRVDLDTVETNMVFVEPEPEDHEELRRYLRSKGILIGGQKPKIRLVTHLDVNADDIDRVISEISAFYRN